MVKDAKEGVADGDDRHLSICLRSRLIFLKILHELPQVRGQVSKSASSERWDVIFLM